MDRDHRLFLACTRPWRRISTKARLLYRPRMIASTLFADGDRGTLELLLVLKARSSWGGGFEALYMDHLIALILEEFLDVRVADGGVWGENADFADRAGLAFIGLDRSIHGGRSHDDRDAAGPLQHLFVQAVRALRAVPEGFRRMVPMMTQPGSIDTDTSTASKVAARIFSSMIMKLSSSVTLVSGMAMREK
ncbi:MAG: hypothetical protein U5M50_16180 [Sphingobium sp.]|nr:hypothetical protein [Sphingobium sp.]